MKRQTAMTTSKINLTIMQTHKASIIGYNKENHQTKWCDEMVTGGEEDKHWPISGERNIIVSIS